MSNVGLNATSNEPPCCRRIAFVYDEPLDPTHGGIQRVSDLVAKGLLAMGYDIYYYSLQPAAEDARLAIPQHTAPSRNINSYSVIDDYQAFLRDNRIDTVIIQTGQFDSARLFLKTGNPAIRIMLFVHNVPLREYSHMLWLVYSQTKPRGLRQWLKYFWSLINIERPKRKCLRHWKQHYGVIADSNAELYLLSERMIDDFAPTGYDFTMRCRSIPNPNTYAEPFEVDYTFKKKEVLFVGRMLEIPKQMTVLLKVWKRIADQVPDWSLTMIGEGPDLTNVQKLSRKMKLPRIQLVGRQDPEPYYRRASICCMTSVFEGFGMVLTESQQHGVAVIAFDSYPTVRDIMDEGRSGVLVKPFSIREYANKLLRLMQDDEYRLSLAKHAKETVQRYNIDTIIDRWVDYLNLPMEISCRRHES